MVVSQVNENCKTITRSIYFYMYSTFILTFCCLRQICVNRVYCSVYCILYTVQSLQIFQFLHPFGRFGLKMGIASMSLVGGGYTAIWLCTVYGIWYGGGYTAITHVWLSTGTSKNINPDRYGIQYNPIEYCW